MTDTLGLVVILAVIFVSSLGLSLQSNGRLREFDATTDMELLKMAWRNEKAASEILHFKTQLIDCITGQIKLMEETLDEFLEIGIDPLTVSIYQMDLDRTQFLLRLFLRMRLQEIEKFTFRIIKSDELHERLSKQEKTSARRCADEIEKHLSGSVLSNLPDDYQSILRQSSTSEEDGMVAEPQLDTFVVCKAREYVSPSEFQDYSSSVMDLPLEMEPGDLSLIPYVRIKKLLDGGKVELV